MYLVTVDDKCSRVMLDLLVSAPFGREADCIGSLRLFLILRVLVFDFDLPPNKVVLYSQKSI